MEELAPKPFTVSSLTAQIKEALESKFTKVYLEAEIIGFKRYPSGHAYFTLKDSGAQISAVMFASSFERCRNHEALKDGAKIIAYGNVSVYAPRGNYQFVVLAAKLAGKGDLMQQFLELKAKLSAEGLFDEAKKRPLPFMPRHIGIVTSEAGAVIHDMGTVLTRRFPNLTITLFPAQVQGAEAPQSLIAGIDYFNKHQPDLVIIARGGGSFEDLFCFNDEALVRAVASCKVPIISAVGHETDFTLCDFAADLRAGTPSIASEIAVPVLTELTDRIAKVNLRLTSSLRGRGEYFAQHVDHLSVALASALKMVGSAYEVRLEQAKNKLVPSVKLMFQTTEARLTRAQDKLSLLSPYGVLSRGYAIVTDKNGIVVKSVKKLAVGDKLDLRLADGAISTKVEQLS